MQTGKMDRSVNQVQVKKGFDLKRVYFKRVKNGLGHFFHLVSHVTNYLV